MNKLSFVLSFKSLSRITFCIFLGIISLSSCKQEDGKALNLLPSAKGGRGELILVMDSAKWQGALGDAIREALTKAVPGLPRPQPMFTVRYIKPHLFAGLLKQHLNIVTVTTFDSDSYGSKILQSSFTPESVQKVMNGERFQQLKRDEYAKGQVVFRLFGAEDESLIDYIKNHEDDIRNFFNKEEKTRVKKDLFSVKGNIALQENLKSVHGFTNFIPAGYRIAKDTAGFVWLRHPEAKIDRNLFFAYQPYTSEEQFDPANIIAWRDSIAYQHIYGDPQNLNSYVVTETLEPVVSKPLELNGKYAVESKGRWKTKNISMGGPFVSYVLLDEAQARIYYIEGFVFSPSVKQREIMREIEVVLNTFKG